MRRVQGVSVLNEEVQEASLRFEKDLKKGRSEPCSRGERPARQRGPPVQSPRQKHTGLAKGTCTFHL